METYDYIIRVSKMGSRGENDESTMTVDDQRETCPVATIKERKGRVGNSTRRSTSAGTSRRWRRRQAEV